MNALVESCVCEYGRESFCFLRLLARVRVRPDSPDTGTREREGRDRRDRAQQQEEGGPVWDSDTCSFLIFFKRVVVKNKSRVRACQLALYTHGTRAPSPISEQKPQPHEKPSLALRPAPAQRAAE